MEFSLRRCKECIWNLNKGRERLKNDKNEAVFCMFPRCFEKVLEKDKEKK